MTRIEDFAKLIPEELKGLSGSVFYSGGEAFQGSKPLYLLGLNPGGDEIAQIADTISIHTKKVLSQSIPWSEYIDEVWKEGRPPGATSMQPRIQHLINELGLDIREVPASNVCFVRSRDEKGISNDFKRYADQCWKFHEAVIKNLKIKMVLCFGQRAGVYVKAKTGAVKSIDSFKEENDRGWKTEIFENQTGLKIVIATHPSRVAWQNKASDPSDIVKRYLKIQNT